MVSVQLLNLAIIVAWKQPQTVTKEMTMAVSNTTLFTTKGSGLDLANRSQFVNPWV